MIKKWHQFINESERYWLEASDIEEVLIGLKDEGYEVFVEKCVYQINGDKVEYKNQKDDIIDLKHEYCFGFQIVIIKSKEKGDDVTLDFHGALNFLRKEGYLIQDIKEDDGNISPNYLHFINGSIITWIPEKEGKPLPKFTDAKEIVSDYVEGDIYISSNSCVISCYQTDKHELTPKDLAEIYNWSDYTTDSSGNIYCELDIEDMADYILSRNSSYKVSSAALKHELVNGIEEDNYYSSEYQPDIQSLFQYDLNKENEVLAVKSLIKELGGLEGFIKECDNDQLEGKSEEEVINFLLKERFYKTLEDVCKYSEIIDYIRQTIGDWKSQAHCERNQEELEEEFDRLIEREGIEFTKSRKEGKRYYYRKIPGTDRKEKVYYDEIVWFYQVKFEERWITDYEKALPGDGLNFVFREWCGDCYFENSMNPHFSDWGDCDDEDLNREIESTLKRYLEKFN